jgi:hypothetical protein
MRIFLTTAAIVVALTAPALAQTGNISGNEAGGAEHGSYRATAVDPRDPCYTNARACSATAHTSRKTKRVQVKKPHASMSATGAR